MAVADAVARNPLPFPLHDTLDPATSRGRRVLIVGDVHGCYGELCDLLDACAYDEGQDVLISVGDACNRGPDSLAVLRFFLGEGARGALRRMVRGNHEDGILSIWSRMRAGDIEAPPKRQYEWVAELDADLAAALHDLPFSLRLPTYHALVVHAGLVPGTPLRSQRLTDILNLRGLLTEDEAVQQLGAGQAAAAQHQRRQGGEAAAAAAAGASGGGRAAVHGAEAAASRAVPALPDARLAGSSSSSSGSASAQQQASSSCSSSNGSGESGGGGSSRGSSSALWSMGCSSSLDIQPAKGPALQAGPAADALLAAQLEDALAAYELVASIPLSRCASSSSSSSSASNNSSGSGSKDSAGRVSNSHGSSNGAGMRASAPALQQQQQRGPDSPLLLVRPERPAAAEEDAGTLFARPPHPPARRRWVGDRDSGQLWAALWEGPEHLFYGHDARRGLQLQRFATGLDGGAVYGNSLHACILPPLDAAGRALLEAWHAPRDAQRIQLGGSGLPALIATVRARRTWWAPGK
ncbi:hypothetical protein ABPG75_002823 [Micractinium tetrahymenae]